MVNEIIGRMALNHPATTAVIDALIRRQMARELRDSDFRRYGFSVEFKGERVDPADVTVYKPSPAFGR